MNGNDLSCSPFSKQAEACAWMETIEGRPYVWGAKGPEEFDCSGAVMWILELLGVMPQGSRFWCGARWMAACKPLEGAELPDRLKGLAGWKRYPKATVARRGMVACYGASWTTCTHVELVMDIGIDPPVMGASGGGSRNKTAAFSLAQKPPACVKRKARASYRRDLLGYVLPPYPLENA